MSVEKVAKPQTDLKLPTPSEGAKQTELKLPTPSEGVKQTKLKLPTPSEGVKQTDPKLPMPSEGVKQTDPKLPTPSEVAKVPTQAATGSKRMSVVTNHTDPKPPSIQHRRRSSAYGSSGINRSRSPRPFEHITEESEGIEVPPVGKIVWFAKQGLWQALDAFLEKLFQENKVQLRFDPELLPENGLTPLMLACRENKFSVVEKLIELGNPVNELDKEGKSALYHAVTSGSDSIVKCLLNAKADPNLTAGENNRNCLQQACSRNSGALEIVKALLKVMGKDAKLIPDNEGNLPLHIAATTRNALLSKELLQSHAEEQLKAVNKEYLDTPLHVAARHKDVDIIKILVDNGANVAEKNTDGQTVLHIACSVGDEATVKYLHSVKANPNIHDKLNRTPLHVATEGGHSSIIEILIDKYKADVNQRSKDGSTLIHLASKCGHPEVALFFVKRGVPLQMPNKEGAICLHEAAKQGHVSVVKSLLLKGASVNVMTKDFYTPLHTAVRHGKHLVVQVVLGFGADVNCRGGQNREAPLHLAARLQKDARHVSEMLLKSGANVNAATEQGVTPLHIAIEHKNYDLVKMLLDENADALWTAKNGEIALHIAVRTCNLAITLALIDHIKTKHTRKETITALNSKNLDGETALHYVSMLRPVESEKGHELDIAKLLVDNSADTTILNVKAMESSLHYCARHGNLEVLKLFLKTMHPEEAAKAVNFQNKDGWSPSLVAAREGNEEIMKVLIDYHARLDIFDEAGKTALHVSAEAGHLNLVELLMQKKAYANAKSKTGLTAVHLAGASGYTEIVETLVKQYNASLDVVAINKRTPLHLAAMNGQKTVISKLLELNADPNSVDANGYTPLHLAAENNHPEVVRQFVSHTPSLIFQANKDGNTCAHIAAAKGSLEVMKELVQCDPASINTRNKRTYETPMHLAASGGHYDLMQFLFSKGGSVEDEDKEGMTPLHLCAKYGHRNLIESLKGKVPLSMSSAKNGLTAIHVGAEYGQAEVVQDLLQKVSGGIPSECPRGKESVEGIEYAYTPLHLSARNGHDGIVRLLLNSHGVKVDAATEGKGLIPLHLALMNGHTSVVSLLLGRSTHQLAIKDNQGRTGLHLAAAHGHLELVTLLLGQGAEVNVLDNESWSPLHYAADAGHVEVVKYLVRMDAETTTEDKNGKTPLAFAAKNHHLAVMKYLVMRDFNVENMLTDRKFLLNLMLCSKLNDNESMIDFILNSPAPIYTACKLARLYRFESTKEKDKSSDLLEMGDYCEQIGLDLLHLSTTFDTENVLNATDDARQPLIDILIDGELKNCVAHANVQGYLGDVWKGDNPLFDGWRTFVLFLLCFLIPPLWAFLSLPYNRYSRVPTLRFICYVISHTYLITLLILVAVIPWNRSYEELFPTPYEWVLLIWLSGMILSEISEPQSRSGLGLLPPIFLALATIAVVIHAFAFLSSGRIREEVMYGRDQVLGLGLLLCVVQCMEFLSLHHLFGPWSIIIRSLIQDLLRFLVILLIFIVGFALQLAIVYKPVYGLKHVQVPTETVPTPKREGSLVIFEHLFFAMFGLTGKSDIDAFDPNTNPPATKYLALIIFGFYEIIIIVVLINLLIAMMSNTYTRLEERSDIEWKFGRAKMIRNMTKTVSTPVPLNIITTLVSIFRIIFKTNCCCCRTDIAKICDEMENRLPEIQMESFVSLDRSTAIEEGSGPKRLVDVVNWGDIVGRYLENKGLHIDDEEDEIEKLAHGNQKSKRRTMRVRQTGNGHLTT
ncbi:serine/threonine-protein phosphatase 6 regulatory ankyrin repeat subunit A-like isoform X2 [Rhopilema esculentum]|uniref:serine/threonine-protein phosphatase 6 regulatory ankyrin repeat subunit A-like isoform X2 n=1 Tax=Rhopilema esculentum TaxID=499914 RepID=UPI0031E38596